MYMRMYICVAGCEPWQPTNDRGDRPNDKDRPVEQCATSAHLAAESADVRMKEDPHDPRSTIADEDLGERDTDDTKERNAVALVADALPHNEGHDEADGRQQPEAETSLAGDVAQEWETGQLCQDTHAHAHRSTHI